MDKNTFTQNLMGQISSLPVPKVKGRKSPYDFSVAQNAPQSRNTDVGISSATAPVKSSPAKSEYINSIASSQQIPSPAGVSNVQTPSGAMVNPSTGAMISGPTPDPKQGYKDAFQEYLNSLRPSQEETQARTYLNKLLDTSRREEEEALNRGETLGFASGEAARVGRNRAFDIEAASGALGALTGDRQAMTEAQKARLEFEKSMLPEEKSISDQYGTGAIGEYNFAKSQGYKGSFTDYQNEDANRKVSIAKAGIGPTGLQTPQFNALNQITTRFQADPIINQAIKGSTASAIADQIIANPESATNQLKSLYVLVKNLDPDSAVREGELALANQTQSYLQVFGNVLTRITEGRVVSPKAAAELAVATKELMTAWNETAQKRQKQYNSQAGILGVGNEFGSYVAGSELGYNAREVGANNPLGI